MTEAQNSPTQPTQRRQHRVTLVFDHPLTDEEVTRLQQMSNALEVTRRSAAAGDHADHEHHEHAMFTATPTE